MEPHFSGSAYDTFPEDRQTREAGAPLLRLLPMAAEPDFYVTTTQEDIDYKQVSSERLAKKKMVFFQCYEGYTPDTNRE